MKRVLLGYNAGGYGGPGYGFWASKPGADISSTNANDFLVAPGLNNLVSIISTTFAAGATLSLARQGSSARFSTTAFGDYNDEIPATYGAYVNHNLGYVPQVWTDLNMGNLLAYAPVGTGYADGAPSQFDFVRTALAQIYVDTVKAGIEVYGWMVVHYHYGSDDWHMPLATSISLNADVRLMVSNAQAA